MGETGNAYKILVGKPEGKRTPKTMRRWEDNRVQNGSGAHPASYPMGTKGSFVGVKAAGA
jgi:hypothetical protein